jgi:hypothetical protein
MGHAEAQAEYDKLKGLLDALGAIGATKDRMLDGVEAALIFNASADALNSLAASLRNSRLTVLSELVGITERFGGN